MQLAAASSSFRFRLDEKSLDLPALFLELASSPISALELAGAHFANLSPAYLDQLRAQSLRTRVSIRSLELRSDFAFPSSVERSRQLADLAAWLHLAADLDIPLLRFHTGKLHPDLDRSRARSSVLDALALLLPLASSRGRLLALHDDAPLFDHHADLLHPFNSPALSLSLDLSSLASSPPPFVSLLYAPFDDDPEHIRRLLDSLHLLESASWPGLLVLDYLGSRDPVHALSQIARDLPTAP